VPLVFVTPDENAAKPDGWSIGTAAFGPGDSLGEMFLRELFHESTTRTHYLEALDRLYDELAVLYVVRPQLFETTAESPKTVTPQSRVALFGALREALVAGRQARPRILFVDGPLPDDVFKPAVRERRAQIIAKHGETEWFAQLLLNELHQHAGAYSIIGVKMALRAAEILNAPQHGMKILSQTDPVPPVSCINDGFIVATGSTPGRALFARGSSGERGATQATFAYNGRQVTLRLKPQYQAKIRKHIQELLSKYELEDDEYWHGVEHLALDVWENWHRREIFDRRDEPQTAARE
jgi:pyrimidine-specific ribonucleoside hydrolase